MREGLTKLLPGAGMALVVLVLLWEPLARGKALVAADFLPVWSPWSERGPALRPHNLDLSDNVLYYYPARLYARERIRRGELPLWNPYIFCGAPFVGNGESSVFSPLSLPFYLLETSRAFGWTAALQLWLAGTFMYLFLRDLGLRKPGAFLGAVVFMLNGFFVVWLEMLNLVAAALWIPLGLLLVRRWSSTGRPVWLLAFAGVVGLELLCGFLQVSLYFLVACGLYWLVGMAAAPLRSGRFRRTLSSGLGLGAASVAGALIAAVQLFPHVELIRLSHRRALAPGWQLVNVDHLRHLATLLRPDLFGSPVTGDYHGPPNYTELCGYIGVLPLALAAVGACSWRRNREVPFLVLLGLCGLFLYLQTPLEALLYWLVPGYRLSIGSSRAILLFTVAGAALAGVGLDRLCTDRRSSVRTAQALLVVLGTADLLHFGRNHLTTVETDSIYPRTETTEFLRRSSGERRVLALGGVFPPNSLMAYGIEEVGGYESLFSGRYRRLMSRIDGAVGASDDYHGIVLSRLDSPVLDALGVRFVVSDHALPDAGLLLRHAGRVRVYEREQALSRAFVVHDYRLARDGEAALEAVAGKDFRPRQQVVLENPPGFPPSRPSAEPTAVITERTAERVGVRAQLAAPGLLVLADSYYPGWQARVDGAEAEILVADYVLRAVALPPGTHAVEFQYRPRSFWAGLAISLGTLVLLAGCGVFSRLRRPAGRPA